MVKIQCAMHGNSSILHENIKSDKIMRKILYSFAPGLVL